MNSTTVQTTCCIAGGGPAGIMAGFLLARAGVRTLVLERHKDFFRDFRGDTIHPSTLQIMHELGLLDAFLKLPHSKVQTLRGLVGDTEVQRDGRSEFDRSLNACHFLCIEIKSEETTAAEKRNGQKKRVVSFAESEP